MSDFFERAHDVGAKRYGAAWFKASQVAAKTLEAFGFDPRLRAERNLAAAFALQLANAASGAEQPLILTPQTRFADEPVVIRCAQCGERPSSWRHDPDNLGSHTFTPGTTRIIPTR